MTTPLETLYDAAKTRRWHTFGYLDQNLAQHSFGVALIISVLHPSPSVDLLKAALWHDLHEKKFGDISHDAKTDELRVIEQASADAFWNDLNIQFPKLSDVDKLWLSLADQFEVVLFLAAPEITKCADTLDIWARASDIVNQKVKELQAHGFFLEPESSLVN